MNMREWPWFKMILAFGAGLIAASAGVAAAANLGTLNSDTTGTSVGVVAACDSSIGATWNVAGISPVYSGSGTVANSTFNVSRLKLTGVDAACDGKNYQLAIANAAGSALESASGTLAVTGGEATISFTATNGKTIEQIVLAIYG